MLIDLAGIQAKNAGQKANSIGQRETAFEKRDHLQKKRIVEGILGSLNDCGELVYRYFS